MFFIQVLASSEDERRRELMVRFDVIPVDWIALTVLDYFLYSKSAQIGATSNKNIDEARGCGASLETRSFAFASHLMPWVVTLENLFFAKVIRELRSRVFQDTKILNSCKNNFINNI